MKRLFLIVLSASILFSCTKSKIEKADRSFIDVMLNDKNSFFYVDTAAYPKERTPLPVGIFDSGTGGLAVLDVILNYDEFDNNSENMVTRKDLVKDFNKEKFIYLGDNANMPYGEYEANNNTSLLKEHIFKDVQFLLGNKFYEWDYSKNFQTTKSPVKAIIIACNTATAYGKEDIEKLMHRMNLGIKVIGVIEAGVRGALENFSKDEDGSIGVFATYGTVCSNGYPDEIKRQLTKNNFTGDIQVYQQGGIGLAGAIDGASDFIDKNATKPRREYKGPSSKRIEARIDTTNLQRYCFDFSNNNILFNGSIDKPSDLQLNSVENNIRYEIISLLEKIRKAPNAKPLKTVILGCTHYPFFIDKFKEIFKAAYNYKENGKYLYRNLMMKNITFIDPSENTAKELFVYLHENNLLNNSSFDESEFYISVPNTLNKNLKLDEKGNFTYDYKYGRKVGEIQEYVKYVPFNRTNLGKDVLVRLKEKIPTTYNLISKFTKQNSKTFYLPDSEKIK